MKDRWSIAWVMACLLPALLFLAACDGGGGSSTTTVVVTNTVNGQPVVVTNTITPPEPQTLQDRTYSVPAGATVMSDAETAPDDGTMFATVDWSGGGQLQADLFRNGAAVAAQLDNSPLNISAVTDDGQTWTVRIINSTPDNKNVNITIRYAPE
ncbi:MAG: hypothetical protein KKC51_01050 [Verrucomicrobia bacterium]|nr:hypothetical protein [Verrucomicrobiota bacterium]